MCTVTYFPFQDKIVLTSNRDEKPHRSSQEIYKDSKILYPKDAEKNGTWCAVSHFGNAIILLNGAFENHVKKTDYRKSRGQIVLDLIEKENILHELETTVLSNIEPFTLVIFQNKKLAEFCWDGVLKYLKILDRSVPHIWSSATLYDARAREIRNKIFLKFLETNDISEEKIWHFHHLETEDLENGITIQRRNSIQTISTTQVILSDNISLKHTDRKNLQSKPKIILLKNELKTSSS